MPSYPYDELPEMMRRWHTAHDRATSTPRSSARSIGSPWASPSLVTPSSAPRPAA